MYFVCIVHNMHYTYPLMLNTMEHYLSKHFLRILNSLKLVVDRPTDRPTNQPTLSGIELLSQLKILTHISCDLRHFNGRECTQFPSRSQHSTSLPKNIIKFSFHKEHFLYLFYGLKMILNPPRFFP